MTDVVATSSISDEPREGDLPEFLKPFWRDWKGSVAGLHIFSGSTNDYVGVSGFTLVQYMIEVLKNGGINDIVVFSPGRPTDKIVFPNPSTKRKFVKLLGLEKQQAPLPAGNPFADFANANQASAPPTDPMDVELPNDYASALGLIVRFLKESGAKRKLTEWERSNAELIIEEDERYFKLPNECLLPYSENPNEEYTLEQLGEERKSCAAGIIERAETVAPNADPGTMPEGQRSLVALLSGCGIDSDLVDSGNPLIAVTKTYAKLHEDIRQSDGLSHIRLPKPDEPKRLVYIRRLEQRSLGALGDGLTPERLAAITAGLDLRHLEDLYLRAGAGKTQLTETLATDRMREIILQIYGERLTIKQPSYGFARVGGHRIPKQWLQEWIVEPALLGILEMYTGIAFIGPPGTLKTTMAEAVAYEMKRNFIIWNAASMRGQYQGLTEAYTEETFEGIRASQPNVVFVDEADKAFPMPGPAVGGAGQAEQNLVSMTQQEMSNPANRGRTLWIFGTNYPELMSPALIRPGRIDVKIPLLTPDDGEERADVFLSQIRLHGHDELIEDNLYPKLVEIGNKMDLDWTQAEQDRAVIKALGLMRIKRLDFADALANAIETLRPETGDVAGMTANAIAMCADNDLIPVRRRKITENPAALKQQVNEYRARERKVRDI